MKRRRLILWKLKAGSHKYGMKWSTLRVILQIRKVTKNHCCNNLLDYLFSPTGKPNYDNWSLLPKKIVRSMKTSLQRRKKTHGVLACQLPSWNFIQEKWCVTLDLAQAWCCYHFSKRMEDWNWNLRSKNKTCWWFSRACWRCDRYYEYKCRWIHIPYRGSSYGNERKW